MTQSIKNRSLETQFLLTNHHQLVGFDLFLEVYPILVEILCTL